VVKHITNTAPKKGGILIFLPGVQEIAQCIEAVRAVVGGADVLPLHANLAGDEQRRVFVANPNKWKIVAATNVAEVSTAQSLHFHSLMRLVRRPSRLMM
jgi:ATP-dependent RNA helicase DHX57